jgi:hypothetical protein
VKKDLQGISEELITKQKEETENCWRYGRKGHYTLECYAQKMEDGEEIIKAVMSATKKRKQQVNISSQKEKKPKVSAQAGESLNSKKRIWEINTDEEEDF